jgi:hypothetical protein
MVIHKGINFIQQFYLTKLEIHLHGLPASELSLAQAILDANT